MRLLIQSDDYAITPAAAQGIIYGIRHGKVRNTGLFANMPWTEECVEWIKPYLDDIAFGIDLNASTGSSVLGYDKVPNLCHEDGSFFTSRENRALDTEENGFDHVDYDQLYAEFEAQIERFIQLTGKVPDYIHNHAYGTKTTTAVSKALAEKYKRPYTGDFKISMGWYQMGASPEQQLSNDPLNWIIDHTDEIFEQDPGYIITHCGFVDKELFDLSSFNICRAVDLSAMCDPKLAEWIEKNNIELITFKDLH